MEMKFTISNTWKYNKKQHAIFGKFTWYLYETKYKLFLYINLNTIRVDSKDNINNVQNFLKDFENLGKSYMEFFIKKVWKISYFIRKIAIFMAKKFQNLLTGGGINAIVLFVNLNMISRCQKMFSNDFAYPLSIFYGHSIKQFNRMRSCVLLN